VEFYLGQYVDGAKLPWHYALVWIAITTPPLILTLFIVGVFSTRTAWDMAMLGLAAAPVAAVVILHSVQYDGWRHLYFIAPFMVLAGISGAIMIWNAAKPIRLARCAMIAICAAHFIFIGAWMARAHPYQNVYFNSFAGSAPRRNFEMDYWGLANRAALEAILKTDPSDTITIAPASLTPLENSLLMLTDDQKRRIHIDRELNGAAYILTNYKWVNDLDDSRFASGYELVYHTDISGMRILSVYRRKD